MAPCKRERYLIFGTRSFDEPPSCQLLWYSRCPQLPSKSIPQSTLGRYLGFIEILAYRPTGRSRSHDPCVLHLRAQRNTHWCIYMFWVHAVLTLLPNGQRHSSSKLMALSS